MLLFIGEVLRLLVDDILKRKAHLRLLLILRLTLQQQLVQCFEILCLLKVQLIRRPREMIRARATKVQLLQGAPEDFLDLPEFLRRATHIILLLHRITDLQIVHVMDAELAVDFAVLALRHYSAELHVLALFHAVFQLFQLRR